MTGILVATDQPASHACAYLCGNEFVRFERSNMVQFDDLKTFPRAQLAGLFGSFFTEEV